MQLHKCDHHDGITPELRVDGVKLSLYWPQQSKTNSQNSEEL
jgi:hypothetical protein